MDQPAQRVANGALDGKDDARMVPALPHPRLMQCCEMRYVERDQDAFFTSGKRKLRFIGLAKPACFGRADRVHSMFSQSRRNGRVDVFVREETHGAHGEEVFPVWQALTVASSSDARSASISSK